MDDLRCSACGSSSLAYPSMLQDDELVACTNCGTVISTYRELKERARLPSARTVARSPLSGC
jgi:DNA-directed RNA polymerase subunit RPC12/RpoP